MNPLTLKNNDNNNKRGVEESHPPDPAPPRPILCLDSPWPSWGSSQSFFSQAKTVTLSQWKKQKGLVEKDTRGTLLGGLEFKLREASVERPPEVALGPWALGPSWGQAYLQVLHGLGARDRCARRRPSPTLGALGPPFLRCLQSPQVGPSPPRRCREGARQEPYARRLFTRETGS